MKTRAIKLIAVFIFGAGTIFAQDIPQSEVPSVVLNTFKKEFPKAVDIEWEKKGEQFNVEFELGWSVDYEAWFSADGKLIRYTEDIPAKDLPNAVKNTITSQYKDYRVDDAEKIVTNGVETYKVELEKGKEEIKVIFSKKGKVII